MGMSHSFQLILASQSPRRRELLSHTGLPFSCVSLDVQEYSAATDPKQFALEIGQLKTAGAREYAEKKSIEHPFFIVSDTLVALKGKILGKPKDNDEARDMLNFLAGKQHQVFTSVGFAWKVAGHWHEHFFVDESKVTFSEIDSEMMEHYLSTGESMDKAGAYGIQGPALVFIDALDGSYSTVMGFPLSVFMRELAGIAKKYVPAEKSWRSLFR